MKFENCGEFDYVGDAAFSFLKSLESVSFSGSELFYLSGQAFYDCQKLKNLDLSNTNVKYIDSCLPIYIGTVSASIDFRCKSMARQTSDVYVRLSRVLLSLGVNSTVVP